jgi:hypothetical protein
VANNGHDVVDISVDYRISGQFVTRLAHFTPNAALVNCWRSAESRHACRDARRGHRRHRARRRAKDIRSDRTKAFVKDWIRLSHSGYSAAAGQVPGQSRGACAAAGIAFTWRQSA